MSTDDLAHSRLPIFNWGQRPPRFSGVRGPNFTQLGEDSHYRRFISLFQISDILL